MPPGRRIADLGARRSSKASPCSPSKKVGLHGGSHASYLKRSFFEIGFCPHLTDQLFVELVWLKLPAAYPSRRANSGDQVHLTMSRVL
jgi:hypothetical protein